MEITSGHVTIFPKIASGFADAIKQPLGVAGTAGAVMLGNVMTKALGAIVAPVKNAFSGGFARLMNIEQAEIKLRTLGINVQQAMSSVNASVDGTKFAISDAADMAAQLGAAGMGAGKDMTRWLSLTADMAQFSNRGFAEMQLLVQDVASQGRVTGEVFNRFPLAVSALSEHLGKTPAEVRKLASAGKISADDFAAAIEGKIGGAAKNAGASFLSLRDNIKTALNATAAHLIKPFVAAAMPIMAVGLDLAKGFRDNVAKPIGESLTAVLVPAAERAAAGLAVLPEVIGSIVAIFRDGDFDGGLSAILGIEEDAAIVGALFGIRSAVMDLWSGLSMGAAVRAEFAGSLSGLVAVGAAVRFAFEELTGGFRAFGAAFLAADGDVTSAGFPGFMEEAAFAVRTFVDGALAGIGEFASGFMAGFGGFEGLLETFSAALPLLLGPLGLLKTALLEVFSSGAGGVDFFAFGESVGAGLQPLLAAVGELSIMFTGALVEAISALMPVAMQLGQVFLELGMSLVSQLLPVITELATALLPPLIGVVALLGPLVADVVAQLLPLVALIAGQLAPVLADVVAAVLPPFVSILGTLIPVIASVVEAVMPLVAALLSALIPAIVEIVGAVLPPLIGILGEVAAIVAAVVAPAILALVQVFTGVLTPVIQGLAPIVSAVFGSIAQVIGAAMQIVQGIIRTVTGVIRGDWSQAWSGMQQIAQGAGNLIGSIVGGIGRIVVSLIEGAMALLVGAFTRGWNAAVAIVQGIPGRILGILGGLGGLLTGAGMSLIDGFVRGIVAGFGRAIDAVRNGMQNIRNFFPFSPAKEGPFSGSGYTSHSGRKLARDFGDAIAAEQAYLARSTGALMSAADFGAQVSAGGASSSSLGHVTVSLDGAVIRATVDGTPLDLRMQGIARGAVHESISTGRGRR